MVFDAQKTMTGTEFEHWVDEQNNPDAIFELIGGEIFQMPSNAFASMIAGRIFGFLFIYLLKNDIGYATVPDGGYKVGDERYAPDVAFVSYTRQKQPDKKTYNSIAPDLAVEVVSDTMNKREWNALIRKITGYLNAGVMVWVVDPEEKTIEVHQYGAEVKIYTVNDTLTIPTLLPNFELPLKAIFVTQSD